MESPEITFPDEGRYIWDWFWQISALRQHGEGGPLGLSPTWIKDWAEITGTIIRREEYAILFQMDAQFLEAWRGEASNNAAIMRDEAKNGSGSNRA